MLQKYDMSDSRSTTTRTAIALSAVVFLTAAFSILISRDHTEIAAVWISNAIILAALLLARRSAWPLLLSVSYVANLLANLAMGNGWIIAVFCSFANIVESLICASVLLYRNTPEFEKAKGTDFLRLILGAAIGALASAAIATVAMSFHNDVAPAELVVAWFLADGLGLLVFTPPFAVLLNGTWRDALQGALNPRTALLCWATFALGVTIVFGQSAVDLLPAAPLLLILAAFAFEASGVALALGFMSTVSIGATALGMGPESMMLGSATDRLHHLQGFLALLALSGMPATIALSQRRRLQESLRSARDEALAVRDVLRTREGQLSAIAEAARDIIVRFDLDTTMTYVSPASVEVLGYEPRELVGCRTRDFVHPEDKERGAAALSALVAAGPDAPTKRMRLRARHKDGSWRWIEGRPRAIFDPMTGRVTALYDVMRDVTDEQEVAEALQLARARAEAAMQVKSEFLANMSHELRTPLNSVIGFSRLLTQSTELNRDDKRFATLIEASSRATLSIVNDILDVSAMERGSLVLRPERQSITDLVDSVRDMILPDAAAKKLQIDLSVAPSLASFHIVDGDRLRQVLLNLTSNAIKFTEVGHVSLKVERIGIDEGRETLRFSVRDTGIGIAPEHQTEIFERFTQAPGGITGGTGLGLSIARSLVELMGGALNVLSSPGAGSTFSFAIALPIGGDEEMAKSPPQRPSARRRILIVDDVDLNLELMQRNLQALGHLVDTASSGLHAIEKCLEQAYDLILLDVRMPGLNGLETTRIIRRSKGPSALVPIIALSAGALPEQVQACLDAGMSGHLAKPVKYEDLAELMASSPSHRRMAPETEMQDLRARFRERLTTDREALSMLRQAMAPSSEFIPIVHRLTGTAGSLGYHNLGEQAGRLNDALERGDPNWRDELTALMLLLQSKADPD